MSAQDLITELGRHDCATTLEIRSIETVEDGDAGVRATASFEDPGGVIMGSRQRNTSWHEEK